jgi:hypothetical protein
MKLLAYHLSTDWSLIGSVSDKFLVSTCSEESTTQTRLHVYEWPID